MRGFELLEPHSFAEAFDMYAAHEEDGCLYISGGTDVIPPIRKGALSPDYLIDLRHLGLGELRCTDGGAVIGAACTMKEIAESTYIRSCFPALAQAAASIGCTQTRGIATIGGNLCAALPSADSAPPLYCYGALMNIRGKDGERTVPIGEFLTGPRKTSLIPGEILTSVFVPAQPKDTKAHFIKFGRRNALTLAMVNEATAAEYDGEKLKNVRITVGACGITPLRIPAAEAWLEGRSAEEIDEEAVKKMVAEGIRPISDIRASAEYRRALAGALVVKSLRFITGRADPDDNVLRGRI